MLLRWDLIGVCGSVCVCACLCVQLFVKRWVVHCQALMCTNPAKDDKGLGQTQAVLRPPLNLMMFILLSLGWICKSVFQTNRLTIYRSHVLNYRAILSTFKVHEIHIDKWCKAKDCREIHKK